MMNDIQVLQIHDVEVLMQWRMEVLRCVFSIPRMPIRQASNKPTGTITNAICRTAATSPASLQSMARWQGVAVCAFRRRCLRQTTLAAAAPI